MQLVVTELGAYVQSVTLHYGGAQVYVKERPPPIPLTEYEERRKKKDIQEICEVSWQDLC